MTKTILIALKPGALTQEQVTQINQLDPEAKVVITDSTEEMETCLDEAEIMAGSVPPDLLVRAKKLRWYQHWGAGIDWLIQHEGVVKKDFLLTNTSGIHAIPISEHILAFMLAFARNFPMSIRHQQQRYWDHQETGQLFELAGKHVLIIGLGAIGKQTAHILSALGMHVAGIRRSPGQPVEGVEYLAGMEDLDRILPQADFVVVTLPLTKDTHHIFNSSTFSKMKKSAYFINIGRGGTVHEADLVSALQEQQIAGAGLDVFETEPLPADSPLWDMPNVIITAHNSGISPLYDQRAFAIFIDNLERYLHNQPLRNLVNKELGY
jgi:phosphoglycerate dehydrogenase-like enzyme